MAQKLVIHINNRNAPKPNRPLIPGTCAVIVNKEGNVLIHKRSDNEAWSLPGGQMKLGESISECILREIREEMGLDVQIKRLIGIYTSPKVVFEFPNGDVFQSFVVAFFCKTKNKNVVLNYESTSHKWVSIKKLSGLITLPFVKEIILAGISKKESVFD